MNNRYLIALFVSVFLLTVMVISWRDGTLSVPGSGSRTTAAATTAAGTIGSGSALNAGVTTPLDMLSVAHPRNSPLTADMLVISDDAPYPVDEPEPSSMLDPTKSEVPVLVAVDNSPEAARHNATIRNLGGEVLVVKVTAVNPPAGNKSIVQIALAPRAEVNLTDAGLVVATGAEISVESPPYLAQTTTVY